MPLCACFGNTAAAEGRPSQGDKQQASTAASSSSKPTVSSQPLPAAEHREPSASSTPAAALQRVEAPAPQQVPSSAPTAATPAQQAVQEAPKAATVAPDEVQVVTDAAQPAPSSTVTSTTTEQQPHHPSQQEKQAEESRAGAGAAAEPSASAVDAAAAQGNPPARTANGTKEPASREGVTPAVAAVQQQEAMNSGPTSTQGGVVPPWYSSGSQTGRGLDPRDDFSAHAMPSESVANVNDILRLNLGEVKLVLQKLAVVNSTPTIALNEAAELLCKHLAVNFCSITGFTDHCTSYVLLAAYGDGASDVERMPVMRGSQWSCAKLLEQPAFLHCRLTSQDKLEDLPADFQVLATAGGLKSFLSIPVATDHEVLGALTIAKEDAEGFEVEWWEPMLGCLSMGLLGPMRNEQTSSLCQLMKQLDVSTDYLLLIHQLLRGAFSLLLRATNIRTGCRLALLNGDTTKALVFEPDRRQLGTLEAELGSMMVRPPAASAGAGAGGPAGANGAQDPHIQVTEIILENTLLLDAVQKGKARFVSDCASYIQSCMKPATDIFISGQEMVASIVVLPLIYEGNTFGGFYVTLETTSNFQKIKDLLMGFVNSVVLVLHKRLQPQRDAIWSSIVNKNEVEPVEGGAAGAGGAGSSLATQGSAAGGGTNSGTNSGAVDSSMVSTTGTSGAKPVFMKRSCTEAMLKVLQHELRKTHAKSQAHEWIEELALLEIVGKGGFGVVYKGSWKGSIAAVKVMYARQHERQAMKDALEMAVLTTVSHPNIIQVYNCFTDMVEDASGTGQAANNDLTVAGPGGVVGRINVRFRRLQPDEDRALATCNILVMEFCDRASLRHAMKKGVFHKRLGSTSVAVDLCAIVQVLIEVAQAIQHLHAMKLIHCDIKPENVLLKSDPSKPIGFVTKLSDFGLAKLLRENYYIVNRSGSGTVTHLAPELFQVGSKLTTAVDTFSFGIMMWELYTGQRAYGGLGRDAIIDRVYKKKARPIFPLGVPPAYAALAKACWDNDPTQRPPFTQVLARLGEMLVAFTSATGLAGAPPPPPAPAAASPLPLPAGLQQAQHQQHPAGSAAGVGAAPVPSLGQAPQQQAAPPQQQPQQQADGAPAQ